MTTLLVANAKLKELYKKVDQLVADIKKQAGINSSDDEIKSVKELDDINKRKKNSEEKFKNTFIYYLLQDMELFKIFLLLLHSQNGLTRYDLTLYLKADNYKELSLEEQQEKIKKNENYTEKSVAHLAALLYQFFPSERYALEIILTTDKIKSNSLRYTFRKTDEAKKIFRPMFDYFCSISTATTVVSKDLDISPSPDITKKQRHEIAEQCIEYVLKDVDSHCDIPNKNYRNNLKSIIKAIQNKTLCKLFYGFDYEEDCEDSDDTDMLFLPLIIRDATAKDIDWNLFIQDHHSDQDTLLKYLLMLDTDPDYVVYGLRFDEDYKGEVAEWYRKSDAQSMPLNKIRQLKLTKHNLTEKGLKESEFYQYATHPIYNLNPYRNLCGEDFYLLLPTEFYKTIPSEIRTECFNYQFDTLGYPQDKAKDWIKSCEEFFSNSNYIMGWGEDGPEGFNLTYYNENAEYSLVKCKNYVEFLNRLNQSHIILPDDALPRELVDRQRFMFIKSFIRKDFIASPHLIQQYEKKLNLIDYEVYPAKDVYKESASDYENDRLRIYLSKFNFLYLNEMVFTRISPNIFCKAICNIEAYYDGCEFKITSRGITLSVYEQNNEHYLIYWDYLNQLNNLSDKKGKQITWEDTKGGIELANEFILNSDQNTNGQLDVSEKLDLTLKTIPLHKVVNIYCPERTYLAVGAQKKLHSYVDKELKLPTDPRLDDITKISRTYYVSFDSDEFLYSLYLPDSFTNVKTYRDINDFLYDCSFDIPDVVRSSLSLKENEYIAENHSLSFIKFETYKRSDVIRFLHEHMGRVFYLDTSEYMDDPLRIIEELSNDCSKQPSTVPNMWEILGTF